MNLCVRLLQLMLSVIFSLIINTHYYYYNPEIDCSFRLSFGASYNTVKSNKKDFLI